jgi:hypothetical protein
VIWQDVNSQTRTHKWSRQGMMEDRTKVTSNDHPLGHLDVSHNEHGRGNWQIFSHLGTSKAILLSSSHFRILFCNCWAKTRSGRLGCCRYKATGERKHFNRQSKETKQEMCVKKEIDHPHNGSSQPDSDHALRKRTGNNLPHGGGYPRSITGGLQFGARGRVPSRHGARNAR